ncbi:citrate lyase subunit beta/citryl-CoA lyase [Halalkalibacter nanhaiisediminis]|uniref:Citrate lyase subunit beta/citryl-CoA lyase n=1 Tax=Halalkalibacter nanhaiisediminis TaxID=688079 RepID=A0A562QDB2_9BACI|nr:citrate lyase subunit beta/citryl-CoA lyase [Halalkalibacter nanhaiisediminis]
MERSYLFVPADRPERIRKAIESPCDAVIIDLEDSVAFDKKATARQMVVETMNQFSNSLKKIYV